MQRHARTQTHAHTNVCTYTHTKRDTDPHTNPMRLRGRVEKWKNTALVGNSIKCNYLSAGAYILHSHHMSLEWRGGLEIPGSNNNSLTNAEPKSPGNQPPPPHRNLSSCLLNKPQTAGSHSVFVQWAIGKARCSILELLCIELEISEQRNQDSTPDFTFLYSPKALLCLN